VSVFKAQGNLKSAAEEIHKILKIVYADQALWLELSEIHLSLGEYQVSINW
jgi:hypothetical protein